MDKRIITNFLKRIERESDDKCWAWKGGHDKNGYGVVHAIAGFQVSAHRVSYIYFIGEIEKGLVIDHLCENTGCINPAHLEPTTINDNVNRTYKRGKLRKGRLVLGLKCLKRGHELKTENDIRTYAYGKKYCKKCRLKLF